MNSHRGQMQDLPNIPHEEQQKQEPTALGNFFTRMTGETYKPKPKPKKGIRRTPLGWMTKEEFKQKLEDNQKKWIDNIEHGFTNIEGTSGVDADTKD
jgi:hypothetical protein